MITLEAILAHCGGDTRATRRRIVALLDYHTRGVCADVSEYMKGHHEKSKLYYTNLLTQLEAL